ncbi:MAG: hypothetical protein IH933_02810 [Euryarchaeota archaeon]|nr:hypothetical protein [Euryarchaeota archaeon]
MTVGENVSDCYTHSREFTHGGNRFRVRINSDRMTYTVVVSREGRVISRRTDLGPEAASCSPAALASRILGRD